MFMLEPRVVNDVQNPLPHHNIKTRQYKVMSYKKLINNYRSEIKNTKISRLCLKNAFRYIVISRSFLTINERKDVIRIVEMKPEHGLRRTVIREWMALPPDRRRTAEQAAAFAAKTIAAHNFGRDGDHRAKILIWLSPRMGRA
jgi:hypothetical protein